MAGFSPDFCGGNLGKTAINGGFSITTSLDQNTRDENQEYNFIFEHFQWFLRALDQVVETFFGCHDMVKLFPGCHGETKHAHGETSSFYLESLTFVRIFLTIRSKNLVDWLWWVWKLYSASENSPEVGSHQWNIAIFAVHLQHLPSSTSLGASIGPYTSYTVTLHLQQSFLVVRSRWSQYLHRFCNQQQPCCYRQIMTKKLQRLSTSKTNKY